MSQKKIIVLVVVVFVLAIGGYLAMRPMKTNNITVAPEAGQNGVAPTPTPVAETSGKKMAFSQFVKQGGSYKCTVDQSMGGTVSKGVTYIDDEKMRGEFAVQAQGVSMTSTFIVRDGYSYTWSSMSPTMGFKIKIAEKTAAPDTTTLARNSFDTDLIGDYDCQPWRADASMFAIPKEVTFTEMK